MNLQKVRFEDINNFSCLLNNFMKREGKEPRHSPTSKIRAQKREWRLEKGVHGLLTSWDIVAKYKYLSIYTTNYTITFNRIELLDIIRTIWRLKD